MPPRLVMHEPPGMRNIFAIKNLVLPPPVAEPVEQAKRQKRWRRPPDPKPTDEFVKGRNKNYVRVGPKKVKAIDTGPVTEVRGLMLSKDMFDEIARIAKTQGEFPATVLVDLIQRGLASFSENQFLVRPAIVPAADLSNRRTKRLKDIQLQNQRDHRPRLGEE